MKGTRPGNSVLVLNQDGSLYHLNLLPKQISEIIIAVGDPGRVYQISNFFDEIVFEVNKREFITQVGFYKNKKITVISTGIGTDNIEIVLTELDALFNMDLAKGEPKSRRKALTIVRIGTTGSIQEDIDVGAHVVAEYGIGLDNLMNFYHLEMSDYEAELAQDIQQYIKLDQKPYVVKGSKKLLDAIAFDMIKGNAITAPGFYAPQGRKIRLPIRYPRLLDAVTSYHHSASGFWLTNFEMETAGYYGLCRLMGHEVISVNAVIANRQKNQFSKDPTEIINSLILKVLNRI